MLLCDDAAADDDADADAAAAADDDDGDTDGAMLMCSVQTDIYQVQRKIGYCPQFDALYDELTAREHLQLYSSCLLYTSPSPRD